MGLKGYRLWVMGQLDSTLQSPTVERARDVHGVDVGEEAQLAPARPLSVALQVVYLKGKL
jgi:hypothetical protein